MRKFSSYGPLDTDLHYYVPREETVRSACRQLVGDPPEKGGHYITVWAPRQCGKTWIMIQALWRLMRDERFHVLKLDLEHLKMQEDPDLVVKAIANEIQRRLKLPDQAIRTMEDFHAIFTKEVLDKPLILILDEFDALVEDAISGIAGVFRHIYNSRQQDPNPSSQKEYLLHAVALVGVRSVLGIENRRGSPFNVQRGMHIANLVFEEVESMYRWYERESGRKVDRAVVERLYEETKGQPGLVSWFGELLSEGCDLFRPDPTKPVAMEDFEEIYAAALQVLPNNTIMNLVNKANREPCRRLVIDMFKTHEKTIFRFDDPVFSFLYLNGVIDFEKEKNVYYAKFPCPFVQRRLFNYFSNELFGDLGTIFEPFEDLSHIYADDGLNIVSLLRKYETHLRKNRDWMFKDAPRRSDMRIREAVFHFNLYEYLNRFFANKEARVWPEFPAGNGKIDLFIRFRKKTYAMELKSWTDDPDFRQSLKQAARYATSLKLQTIYLVEFVEYVPDEYRGKYEAIYQDGAAGPAVVPVFVATGA